MSIVRVKPTTWYELQKLNFSTQGFNKVRVMSRKIYIDRRSFGVAFGKFLKYDIDICHG